MKIEKMTYWIVPQGLHDEDWENDLSGYTPRLTTWRLRKWPLELYHKADDMKIEKMTSQIVPRGLQHENWENDLSSYTPRLTAQTSRKWPLEIYPETNDAKFKELTSWMNLEIKSILLILLCILIFKNIWYFWFLKKIKGANSGHPVW